MQVERQRDGKRRVTQVTDVCGLEGDTVILNDIFLYQVEGESLTGGLVGRYKINRARPSFHHAAGLFRPRPRLVSGAGRGGAVTPILPQLLIGALLRAGRGGAGRQRDRA